MNVLVIAPHPDDESIGCGGTLCLHARRGDPITVAYLTSGELGLKHLARNKARLTREREAARLEKTRHFRRGFFEDPYFINSIWRARLIARFSRR